MSILVRSTSDKNNNKDIEFNRFNETPDLARKPVQRDIPVMGFSQLTGTEGVQKDGGKGMEMSYRGIVQSVKA